MPGTMLDEKWLASADFGPAVLRLRLLEVQLILNRANLSQDIRERARQVAQDLRQAIANRHCTSRADVSAKLSLLLDTNPAAKAEHTQTPDQAAPLMRSQEPTTPCANHPVAA